MTAEVAPAAEIDPPLPPIVFDQLDIPETLAIDIALRIVYVRGICTIHMLAGIMKIPLELAEAIFRRLNDQQYFEVRRASGDDYVFSLSAQGRRLAAERSLTSRYTGPAPVSLKSWAARVRAQVSRTTISREQMSRAFADIVVSDQLLDALGPALISQRSIFLYGPSGTGKTTISERLIRVFEDTVLIPYCVEVEGQIILVADPAVHQTATEVDARHIDPRWIPSRRPFISAGGKLVTSMLDLQKDESTGAWMAPLQMKASNGILLIDDFGRQLISPRDLLNRWIVPLDRRIDFLSLSTSKFEIPFELLILFSTNLEPHELADEAFLRRIPNKILIDAVSADAFDLIFRAAASAAGLEYEPGSPRYCRELCLRHSPDLRACFPRDLCNAIRAITLYECRKPAIGPRARGGDLLPVTKKEREGRPEERFSVDFQVMLSWQEKNGQVRGGSARCVDLSASGLGIETRDAFPAHSIVLVRSEQFGRMGHATIRYCRREGMKYSVGLLFSTAFGLGDPVRRKILEKVLRPNSPDPRS